MATVQAKVDEWIPRGVNFFGPPHSRFTAACREYGLKAWDNADLAAQFLTVIQPRLEAAGLRLPNLTDSYPHSVL